MKIGGSGDAPKIRKFYKTATIAQVVDQGIWEVHLDSNVLKTTAKRDLHLPTRSLAQAIAYEWNVQQDHVIPSTMPVTQLVFTGIDNFGDEIDIIRDETAKYGETDLLCYRVSEPKALGTLQDEGWQPLLDWAAKQTDRVIDVIDKVKAQTTDRAVTVLRAVVFGLVIAVLGVAAATILASLVIPPAYRPWWICTMAGVFTRTKGKTKMRDHGMVVVSNHLSYFDRMTVAAAVRSRVPLATLIWHKVNWLNAHMARPTIAVRETGRNRNLVDEIKVYLQHGNVLLFPEATVTDGMALLREISNFAPRVARVRRDDDHERHERQQARRGGEGLEQLDGGRGAKFTALRHHIAGAGHAKRPHASVTQSESSSSLGRRGSKAAHKQLRIRAAHSHGIAADAGGPRRLGAHLRRQRRQHTTSTDIGRVVSVQRRLTPSKLRLRSFIS